MTDNTELAFIQGPAQKVRELIGFTALVGRGDPFYSDVYVSLTDGLAETVVGLDGNIVMSYNSFPESGSLSEVSVESGDHTQAIINVADFMTYLDFASDGGEVRVSFRGDPDDELAKVMEITGALNTRVRLPAGSSILEEVPLQIRDRFNDDNEFTSGDNALPVTIETEVETMERLIEIVDYDPDTNFYPISVKENGDDEMEFSLSVGEETERNAVWGELEATSVESPAELSNDYETGFEEVFGSLHGTVTLQTAPGGGPLCVVQSNDDHTVRHIIGGA